MKIVAIADPHADRDTLGISRTREVEEHTTQAVEYAIDAEADLFVCLGDIGDPDSGGASYRAMEIFIKAAIRLAQKKIPSIWIAGNHDVFEDGTGATMLTPMRAIGNPLIHVAEAPLFVKASPDVDVLCLPYAPVSHAYDPAAVARAHFTMKSSSKTLVLAHLMIAGVVPGEETTDMPRGRDVAFPIAETERAAMRLNGHYHHRQTTAEGIIIPGSLCRFTFADEQHEPGFLSIEL
jgi:DNA repair exonuclease SbcCD nuclease subunit